MSGGVPPSHVRGGTLSHVGGGGYPVPCLGGYPIPCPGGIPHPRSGGGTPSHVGGGYPPNPDLGWGTPPRPRPGMGYPPRPDLGWSTPPRPEILRWGTPPPPASVDRYTDWCQNITFPRTTYAGGNNTTRQYRPRPDFLTRPGRGKGTGSPGLDTQLQTRPGRREGGRVAWSGYPPLNPPSSAGSGEDLLPPLPSPRPVLPRGREGDSVTPPLLPWDQDRM